VSTCLRVISSLSTIGTQEKVNGLGGAAGVRPQGGGDIEVPGASQQGHCEIATGGEHLGGPAGSHLARIFS
jgi:hypothetical protein